MLCIVTSKHVDNLFAQNVQIVNKIILILDIPILPRQLFAYSHGSDILWMSCY